MNAGLMALLRVGIYHRVRSSIYSASKRGKLPRPFAVNDRISKTFLAACIPTFLVVRAASKKDKESDTISTRGVIERADQLYDGTKFDDLYELLAKHSDSQEAEILWRLSRAIFEKCKNIKDDKQKLALYEEALIHVTKALTLDETCWPAHKWTAILLDYVWRCKSTKGRIMKSFEVREHMERAIELNPKDSTSYYLLGEWCYTFAELPWYQRKAAAVIFATPPTSTYEEALKYFEAAENNDPHFYSMNLLMMGKCLLKLQEKDRAIKMLKQARDYPQKTSDDIQACAEAEELLKKLI